MKKCLFVLLLRIFCLAGFAQTGSNLTINGGGLRLERVSGSNHWEMGTDNGDDLDFVYNGISKGYMSNVTGALTVVSDLRMKKDIQLIETVLPGLMKAITYQNFSVVAIKAIQEQQKEIEELKEKNNALMTEFGKLQLMVKDLVKMKGN